ncbi:acyl transferase/acyl hydrolase/lysophospholipase [Xylaria arbuscula]|nr:acyl transferase/acyl hydrolase/lysophospholipase [Xylaria arbuscula]
MPGLRLLSLDGGGVRGLVTLTILKRLLYLINPENPPKPCDVFDVIAGTSTGGLIAIMLGLLEMDVETCIETYLKLSKVVFKPRKRAKVLGRILLNTLGQAPFDHKLLEQEIKRLAFEKLGDENAPLYQQTAKCKVFVCTSLSNTETIRLRSYDSRFEDRITCTIWEAGRATSAAPMFFDPIRFSNGLKFRDGALRANNPTFELAHEVMAEFSSEEITAIVSIGTGIPGSIIMGNGLASVAKACGLIATDTEKSARQFEADYCSTGGKLDGKYFRFNVTRGVDGVRLEEWHKTDIMVSSTISYLGQRTTRSQLQECAEALGGIIPNELIIRLDRSRTLYNPFYQLDRIGKTPVPYFIFRQELNYIHACFQNIFSPSRSRVVCLLGLGGSGKTQLTLQYAWSKRESFGVVLWIDAGSRAALSASFRLAASQLGLRLPPHEKPITTDMALTKDETELESDVAAVKQHLLNRNQPWLMIFDQADDDKFLEELEQYIPSDSNGHILLSSRRKEAYRLAQKAIIIEGLSPQGARNLLLYHADIQEPTDKQVTYADKIVRTLDYIALAVDLAGSYIQNPGGLRRYLDLYVTNKEELYKRSLGKVPSKLTGYTMSVFTAWRISMAAIPENTARFLHLLCFLDPTNLSKDLFRRACTVKDYWTDSGQKGLLKPSDSGVPSWLLELLCDAAGNWSEFKFHEVINQLASFFFVQQEIFRGSWLHQTGPVESSSFVTDGDEIVLLKLPQPLHDLGRYYHTPQTRRVYCYEALAVLIHGFRNEISSPNRNISTNSHETAVLYVGAGGEADDVSSLQRHLEEFERHIQILRYDIEDNIEQSQHRYRCFDDNHPPWYIAEAIMFASVWWRDLVYISNHNPSNLISPWGVIMEIADALVPHRHTWTLQNDRYLGKLGFQQRWALQHSTYHDIIYQSDMLKGLQPILTLKTLYRIGSKAVSMALSRSWSSEYEFLSALSSQMRTQIEESRGTTTAQHLLFEQWRHSPMGQNLLGRLK